MNLTYDSHYFFPDFRLIATERMSVGTRLVVRRVSYCGTAVGTTAGTLSTSTETKNTTIVNITSQILLRMSLRTFFSLLNL